MTNETPRQILDREHGDSRRRWRERYDQYAPYLVIFIGIVAAAGIWVGASASLGQGDIEESNAKLISNNQTLLLCLNDYAAETSQSSRKVREASVRVDAATVVRDAALNKEGVAFLRFVEKLIAGKANGTEDLQPLKESLGERAEAAAILDTAQKNLDRVRKENPIPEAPAVFCKLDNKDLPSESE